MSPISPAERLRAFIASESAGGIILIVAAALALAIANSPLLPDYQKLLSTPVAFSAGSLVAIDKPLLLWINDGLMALFFFLIGLEVKREIVTGQLRSWKQASLPIIAAIGGMAVPAIVFVALNLGSPENLRGWAIPAATDVAFALGLSGGFIEPLESTAIHMIDMGLRWLLQYFPSQDYEEATRDAYNKVSDGMFNEVRDFICLHYRLNNRTDDPYWMDSRTQLKISDRLEHLLDLWKHQLPTPLDVPSAHLFTYNVFTAVLLGKQVYDNGYGDGRLNRSFALPEKPWKAFLRQSAARNRAVLEHKADHKRTLLALRGELRAGLQVQTRLGEVDEASAAESALF